MPPTSDSKPDAKTKIDAMRRAVAKYDRLTGRMSDAERKRLERARQRELLLAVPADLRRRRACLDDPFELMRQYFGWIFSQPFTPSRKAMVEGIIHAARYSGDYATAAIRGGGKTDLAQFTSLWLDLRGELRLPLIIGKNQAGMQHDLEGLKQAICESPDFEADFPEVCRPIIALEDWASKARMQTVNGARTRVGWGKDCIFLPTIAQENLPADWPESEPSAANGAGVAVVGIDGRIRGFKRRNVRPDLAIIDDVDDRGSARSDLLIGDKKKAVDNDVAGLGGSGARVSRIMLCTTINYKCIAAEYTAQPSWHGQRFPAITKMPDRTDLRDKYIEMRQGRTDDDPDARDAHRFYVENRDEIERGGEVDNPFDFVSKLAKDGELLEVSAFQRYFNWIADQGWDSFLCECQQDPPKPEEPGFSGLTADFISRRRVGAFERYHYPEETALITIGADVQKLGLHYVVIAWNESGAGWIIDHDYHEFMTEGRPAADCELLILEGLMTWRDRLRGHPFLGPPTEKHPDGLPRFADLILIDMGWKEKSWSTQPVSAFCIRAGLNNFRPSKGIPNYHRPAESSKATVGDNWHMAPIGGVPVVHMNATHWKLKVQEGFLADPGQPGSLVLCQPPMVDGKRRRRFHFSYSQHILAETWDETRACFIESGKPNHWLDATYEAIVARSICGISVLGKRPAIPAVPRGPVVRSGGLQNQARW